MKKQSVDSFNKYLIIRSNTDHNPFILSDIRVYVSGTTFFFVVVTEKIPQITIGDGTKPITDQPDKLVS